MQTRRIQMTTSYKEFDDEGYYHGTLLSTEQVNDWRKRILEFYFRKYENLETSKKQALNPVESLHELDILKLITQNSVVGALDQILGDDWVLIPDFNIHINSLYLNGWHVDAGSEFMLMRENFSPWRYDDSLKKIIDPSFRQIKCGIYLQDNEPGETGGGIDYLSKSHHIYKLTGIRKLDYQLARIISFIYTKFGSHTAAPTKAGDFLIFDSLLKHKGSHPSVELFEDISDLESDLSVLDCQNWPLNDIKIVIYFSACTKEKGAEYLKNCHYRINKYGKEDPKAQFWREVTEISYPKSYTREQILLLQNARVVPL